MDDDWTSVPPHRRPEVRRRVAVVRRFLAIENPTPNDRAQAMAELGLSRASFHNLVRVMKAGGGLSELQGAGPAPGSTGRPVDAVVDALIEKAIENVGADKTTADVHREVERLCTLAGIVAPSSVTVRKRHLEVAKWQSTSPIATLVVDHCAVLLPVDVGGRLLLPVVTAAFLEPEGLIVSHSTMPLQPVCTDVARVLLRCVSSYGQERRLRTFRLDGPAWNVLADVFRAMGIEEPELRKRRSPGHEFRRLTGASLGGAKLAIQSTLKPVVEPREGLRTYSGALAREIVDDAVREHNASRGLVREKDAPRVSVGAATPALQQGLEWLSKMPRQLVYGDVEIPDLPNL